ncbi:MAG: hypothetical protein R6U87_08860 [Thiohalospira sp.]
MLALPAAPLLAEKPGDAAALEDIEEGRIVWDVTLGDPEALSGRLDVVNETYDDLVRQDVKPRMVFAFRGGAARVIATDVDAHFDLAERNAVLEVQEKLAALLERPGVTMEACSIATRRHNLDQSDLLPGIDLVGNTFLSLMGYGQRGYVAIPLN